MKTQLDEVETFLIESMIKGLKTRLCDPEEVVIRQY
jgi:hypothetical protein